jgi:hypothetical protein
VHPFQQVHPPLVNAPSSASLPFFASAPSSAITPSFSKCAFLSKCALPCISLSLEGGSIGMKAPYPRQNHQRKKEKQEKFVSHPYMVFNTNCFFGFLNICCITHTLLRVLSLWWIYIYIYIYPYIYIYIYIYIHHRGDSQIYCSLDPTDVSPYLFPLFPGHLQLTFPWVFISLSK